jgi:hypothetical protein
MVPNRTLDGFVSVEIIIEKGAVFATLGQEYGRRACFEADVDLQFVSGQ